MEQIDCDDLMTFPTTSTSANGTVLISIMGPVGCHSHQKYALSPVSSALNRFHTEHDEPDHCSAHWICRRMLGVYASLTYSEVIESSHGIAGQEPQKHYKNPSLAPQSPSPASPRSPSFVNMPGGPSAAGGHVIGASGSKVALCLLVVAPNAHLLLEQILWHRHDKFVLSTSPNCLLLTSAPAFSAFGGILFGYDTGVISGVKEMLPWLQQFGYLGIDPKDGAQKWMISSSNESLVVSILSAGTFFGALLAAPTAGPLFAPVVQNSI